MIEYKHHHKGSDSYCTHCNREWIGGAELCGHIIKPVGFVIHPKKSAGCSSSNWGIQWGCPEHGIVGMTGPASPPFNKDLSVALQVRGYGLTKREKSLIETHNAREPWNRIRIDL